MKYIESRQNIINYNSIGNIISNMSNSISRSYDIYRTIQKDLNITIEELNDRFDEFCLIKDNKLDLISLNQLYDFYKKEFDENKFL